MYKNIALNSIEKLKVKGHAVNIYPGHHFVNNSFYIIITLSTASII